ncbi:GNAT family N-acetyltransferase [Candidatus Bathyarchaeota archaeon]|nr:GNAT family N-acetyltransferase [Candidatus Bathyarchaeota archaeon]
MKIITYRELQSKGELLPLFQHAFWYPFNPKEFEKIIRADPRLKNGPVGYAAVEDDHIVGFVGVMDIVTRTIQDSEEVVGGIWGVVTHPVHARKGIFKTLMQRSHSYFKEQGYKFSLLYTSKILIAYAFYRKLGYKDTMVYPSAYKIIKEERKTAKKTRKKIKLDWGKLVELYNQKTKNCTGFVIRDKQYGRMLETRKRIQPEKSVVTDKGYAFLREDEGNMYIKEIIALSKEETGKLISEIEEKTAKEIIYEKVAGKDTLETCKSHGYMIMREGYDLLMSKQLADTTFTETYAKKFYTTSADSF